MRDLAMLEEKLKEIDIAEEELILHGEAYISGVRLEKGSATDEKKLTDLKQLYQKKIQEIQNKEITIEECNYFIRQYLEAEKAVLQGQEYTIDGQQMKRANLEEIRKGRIWWENRKHQLESNNSHGIQFFQICPSEF